MPIRGSMLLVSSASATTSSASGSTAAPSTVRGWAAPGPLASTVASPTATAVSHESIGVIAASPRPRDSRGELHRSLRALSTRGPAAGYHGRAMAKDLRSYLDDVKDVRLEIHREVDPL